MDLDKFFKVMRELKLIKDELQLINIDLNLIKKRIGVEIMAEDDRPLCNNTDCDGCFDGRCDTKTDSEASACEGNTTNSNGDGSK